MKPFRFRPTALLELRQRERDAAQTNLARARQAADAAEAAVRTANEGCEEAIRSYRATLATGVDIDTLERHRNWITRQRATGDALRGEADRNRDAVASAIDIVRSAHQRVRVLERLRERVRRRHEESERRQEAKEMDQLAALQHCYRKGA